MIGKKSNEPVRLYKKPERKQIELNPFVCMFVFVIIIGILAILLAIACKSPYNMNWA